MAWRAAAAFSLAVLMAGCAAPSPASAPAPIRNLEFGRPGILEEDRPVVASTTYHESFRGEVFLGDGFGSNSWAPRDAVLSYSGLDNVFDEWGRPIPAQIFRYEAMQYNQTTDKHAPVLHEHLWTLADDRYLGFVDMGLRYRTFSDPTIPGPFAFGYESVPLLFMALHERAPEQDLPFHDGEAALLPYTGARDFPGDCTPWQFVTSPADGAWPPPARRGEPLLRARTVLCMVEGETTPLWAYRGDDKNGMGFERTGPDIKIEGRQGEPLAPLSYETLPWESLAPPAGVPGLHDVWIPPLGPDNGVPDWSAMIRQRIDSLWLWPGFLEYNVNHPESRLWGASAAQPYRLGSPVSLVPPPPLGPFDIYSGFFFAEGSDHFLGIVLTRLPDEGPEISMVYPGSTQYKWEPQMPRAEIPGLVPISAVQTAMSELAPIQPAWLEFIASFPSGVDWGPPISIWRAVSDCWHEADGEHFVEVSGETGALRLAGPAASHEWGCTYGPYEERTIPSEPILIPSW